MDPACEFCRAQWAVVYCKSDAARLCLPCDAHVHSANALASRHVRALVCDVCLSEPAVACRPTDRLSLCEACDHLGPGPGGRQPVGCYSGCPSLSDLARACMPLVGTTTVHENVAVNAGGDQQLGHLHSHNQLNIPHKLGGAVYKATGIYNDAGFFESFPTGGLGFNSDDTGEIYGSSGAQEFTYAYQDQSGIEGLSMERDFSVADSNGRIESAIEASSSVHDWIPLQSSLPADALQVANGNGDQVIINLSDNINSKLLTGNFPPNISLSVSNHTGESSAADYQDCGASPMLRTAESQWDSNLETSFSLARDKAMMRYNEKKKSRSFGKPIKYVTRKTRADTRKRLKGRFVKAGQDFDSDPLLARGT